MQDGGSGRSDRRRIHRRVYVRPEHVSLAPGTHGAGGIDLLRPAERPERLRVIEGVHQAQALVEVALRRRLVGRYRIREIAERGEERGLVGGVGLGPIGQQPRELHPSLEGRVALLGGHAAYGRE
jgi:hypothetical protein